jgi:hypothetical protein
MSRRKAWMRAERARLEARSERPEARGGEAERVAAPVGRHRAGHYRGTFRDASVLRKLQPSVNLAKLLR